MSVQTVMEVVIRHAPTLLEVMHVHVELAIFSQKIIGHVLVSIILQCKIACHLHAFKNLMI